MASLYNTSPVMSPTDSMSSLSNLEKFMESASACTTPYNRSSTSSPTHFPQQQSASSCSNWQAALVQQQPDCVSMMSGSESAMYCNKQQQGGGGGGSMQGYLGSAPELLGSTMMSNDWQHLLDTNTRFGSMRVVPLVSMQVQAATAGIMEEARIRELIARSGSLSSFQWGALDTTGITVDPSKGGFALQGGTVRVGSLNAASSHCLEQFTSDPAFAERAAKYSSFGAGKCSQIALPVTVENSSKPRGGLRSVEIGSTGKISGTSSLNLKTQQHGLAAVATSLEDNVGLEGINVAVGEVEVDRDDEHEEALADDKSLPVATAAAAIKVVQQQQELEAVEGATEAMSMGDHHRMMMTHVEVEVAAAVAQDNSSCSEQQQQVGSRPGGSSGSPDGGAEPASLSPARSDDRGSAKKRKDSAPAAAGDIKADISYRDSKGDADIVDDVKPKRCKGGEEGGRADRDQSLKLLKGERSCSDNSAESGSPRDHHKENHHHKLRDHSKQDYIHVRARRGQATDSHSLAERVRREKISERMKYLQDLVPGCSKVTGKAVMLDEIINYVQSLQRQVEHLSMKLASVNPGRPEFNLENLMSNKEVSQSARMSSVLVGPDMNAPLGTLFQQQQQTGIMLGAGPCGIDFRSMGTGMDTHLRRSFSNPISSALSGMTAVDAFDDNVSQSVGWDGELQSIVNHMGLSHSGRFGASLRGSLHCPLRVGHMKAEF